ncbi:MAG: SGNH/GDSL hydrolase family protein [Patescibacteria group bacterium]
MKNQNFQILFFGDSITFGNWDNQKGGWFYQLRDEFSFLKTSKRMYNLGIPNEGSSLLKLRIKNEIVARYNSVRDNYIVIAIGANDCCFDKKLNKHNTTPSEYLNNLNTIYNEIKDISKKIIFISITPVIESKTELAFSELSYSNQVIKGHNSALVDFCTSNKIDLINLNKADLESSDFDEDGLHPNFDGHQKMYKLIAKSLKKLFDM